MTTPIEEEIRDAHDVRWRSRTGGPFMVEMLQTELQTFDARRDELLGTSLGKWVLIQDGELIGTFETQRDAINVGYRQFGNVPFLVKQVVPVEMPQNYVSNHLGI